LKQILVVLESVITVILVVVAIAGIAYHTFRDGGWFSQGVGKISHAFVNYPLMALAASVALFFGVRSWRAQKTRGSRTKFFDYVVYVLMAIGIYFIGRYVINGEI